MKIGVCVKSTPDTDTRIKTTGDGIDESGIKWIISPYDAFALEKAVQTAKASKGEVILFTVGGSDVQKNLRDGLAVGGDRAVHINDDALNGADSAGIATALAAALKAEGVDQVWCGKKAVDGDSQQVPSMIAEALGWPQVTQVTEFEQAGDDFTATRAIGGGLEQVVKGSGNAVFSAEVGLATPRYAKLPDIMKAKRKKIDTKTLADLGVDAGAVAPKVALQNFGPPPARPAGRILSGDREAVVKELVQLLRDEAKVL